MDLQEAAKHVLDLLHKAEQYEDCDKGQMFRGVWDGDEFGIAMLELERALDAPAKPPEDASHNNRYLRHDHDSVSSMGQGNIKNTIEWAIRYIEKVSDMTRTPEKQNLLAALKALDVPETPPEEEQELVRRIQSHGIKLSKNASGQTVIMDVLTCTEEKGIALLSAYADSIRKQCADRASTWFNNDETDINNLETLENQEFSLRAAVRAPLVEAGEALVKEWDILPAEIPLRIEDIIEWLQRYLGPQVEALRAALEAAKGQG